MPLYIAWCHPVTLCLSEIYQIWVWLEILVWPRQKISTRVGNSSHLWQWHVPALQIMDYMAWVEPLTPGWISPWDICWSLGWEWWLGRSARETQWNLLHSHEFSPTMMPWFSFMCVWPMGLRLPPLPLLLIFPAPALLWSTSSLF